MKEVEKIYQCYLFVLNDRLVPIMNTVNVLIYIK